MTFLSRAECGALGEEDAGMKQPGVAKSFSQVIKGTVLNLPLLPPVDLLGSFVTCLLRPVRSLLASHQQGEWWTRETTD